MPSYDPAELDHLFARVQSLTYERDPSLDFLSAQDQLAELRANASGDAAGPLWVFLVADGAPVGYALCELNTGANEGVLVEHVSEVRSLSSADVWPSS